MRHRLFLLICLAAFIAPFSSCTTTAEAKKDNSLVKDLSSEEKAKFKAQLEELEVGRNMAGRLITYYGVIEDPQLVNYVNQVGNYVASYSDFEDRRFMFHILDDEAFNAFASPGGFILISVGALRLAKNEAELAMILGHEITHVGKEHMMTTLKSLEEEELNKAANRSKVAGGLPPSVKARRRPTPEKGSDTAALLGRYLSGGGGAGLNAIKVASAGMTKMLEEGMDHKYEFEADRLGVKYAIRGGYDPRSLTRFFSRLMKAKGVDASIMTKTHPSFKDRISNLNKLYKEIEASEIIGARGKKRFNKYMKRLPARKNS